jgi:rod shape-determining protein MreB
LSESAQFRISVSYRNTEISARRDQQTIWQNVLNIGGIDCIITLVDYLRFKRDLLVGRITAERIILEIGSALPLQEERTVVVRGRDLTSELPRALEITSIDVREAIAFKLNLLVDQIASIFHIPDIPEHIEVPSWPQKIPTQLRAAITANPIVLAGEFGQLSGFDQIMQNKLNIVVVSENSSKTQ